MWRTVGWLLPSRLSLLDPVLLPAKPNLILLPAKPNQPPSWRLLGSSPCLAAKPKKTKKDDKSSDEDEKMPRNKHANTSKYIKANKVNSVDVWDSMSLADLGNEINFVVGNQLIM